MKDLEIGRRVRTIRTSYGLTQGQFGLEINKSAGYISLLEKGNIYSLPVLDQICSRFSVNKSWLRSGIGEMKDAAKPEPELTNHHAITAGAGNRIKLIRTACGLTQEEFANNLSYSSSLLYSVEDERRNVTMSLISAVSERFNVPTEYLVDGAVLPSHWLPPGEVLDMELVVLIRTLITNRHLQTKLKEELGMVAVGAKIQELRLQKSFSQAQLGEMVGKSMQTISGYERGVSVPPPDVLEKIADALGVDVSTLALSESR